MSAPDLKVAEVAAPASDPSRRIPRSAPVEAAAVLLSPLVAFFGLHVARMVRPDMIDPYLYTAYAQNGRDLIERYGDGLYYWVRLGFLLPARAAYLAFGPVAGFYALRYLFALIAVVPLYLLLRRLHGPAAGALGVAVALTSPVVLHSWGTDYPDSAAVAYLFAGTACLVMPTSARRPGLARLAWVTLAGVAFALTVHSQFVSAPLVGAIVIAYVAVNLRRMPLEALARTWGSLRSARPRSPERSRGWHSWSSAPTTSSARRSPPRSTSARPNSWPCGTRPPGAGCSTTPTCWPFPPRWRDGAPRASAAAAACRAPS